MKERERRGGDIFQSRARLVKYTLPFNCLRSDLWHILAIPHKICRPWQFVLSFFLPSSLPTSVKEAINIKRDHWAARLVLARAATEGRGLCVICEEKEEEDRH